MSNTLAKTGVEDRGYLDKEIKRLNADLGQDPTNSKNWFYLGAAYYERGDYEDALNALANVRRWDVLLAP